MAKKTIFDHRVQTNSDKNITKINFFVYYVICKLGMYFKVYLIQELRGDSLFKKYTFKTLSQPY